MKNYIQKGDTLTVSAPADVLSGDLVVVGSLMGVASWDATAGSDLELETEGVFELPKLASGAISVGDKLYWDGTQLTKVAGTGSKPLVGVAVAAAADGATTVLCRLAWTGTTGPA